MPNPIMEISDENENKTVTIKFVFRCVALEVLATVTVTCAGVYVYGCSTRYKNIMSLEEFCCVYAHEYRFSPTFALFAMSNVSLCVTSVVVTYCPFQCMRSNVKCVQLTNRRWILLPFCDQIFVICKLASFQSVSQERNENFF